MTASKTIGMALLAFLLVPPWAEANFLCRWLGQCFYRSPAFRLTVVDQETGQPLADVHAMALWVQYGYHGTNGPLMVQDAVSGPDGVLAFAAWGPKRGSTAGLMLNQDPVITLFRPGYRTLNIHNAPATTDEKASARAFTKDRQTFQMTPFRGTRAEWVAELHKTAYPGLGGVSDSQARQFCLSYVNRMRRIRDELRKVPREKGDTENFIRAFEGGLQHTENFIRAFEDDLHHWEQLCTQ